MKFYILIKNKPTFVIALLMSLLASKQDFAQGINSTYSRFGIGMPQLSGNAKAFGMGGIQSPIADAHAINVFNPASYSFLEITGLQLAGKANFLSAKTETESLTFKNGSIGELAMAFKKPSWKWGFAFGLHPYSNVGYSLKSTKAVNDSLTATYVYNGTGGLNEGTIGTSRLFMLHHNRIVATDLTTKRDTLPYHHILSIGANMNYVFGNIAQVNTVAFDSIKVGSRITKNTFAQGLLLQGGIIYQMPISLVFENKKIIKGKYLQLGATYCMGRDIRSNQNTVNESIVSLNGVVFVNDTGFVSSSQKGNLGLPQKLTFGIAFKSFKQKSGSILIGLDYSYQNWSNYFTSIGDQMEPNNYLNASSNYAFGFDYRPSISMKDNFLHRLQYRMGARYTDTHLVLNNKQITQKTVTAGLTMPIMNGDSKFHLSAEYGLLGTTESNLILEKQYTFWIGFTFAPLRSKERWFHTYQYD